MHGGGETWEKPSLGNFSLRNSSLVLSGERYFRSRKTKSLAQSAGKHVHETVMWFSAMLTSLNFRDSLRLLPQKNSFFHHRSGSARYGFVKIRMRVWRPFFTSRIKRPSVHAARIQPTKATGIRMLTSAFAKRCKIWHLRLLPGLSQCNLMFSSEFFYLCRQIRNEHQDGLRYVK